LPFSGRLFPAARTGAANSGAGKGFFRGAKRPENPCALGLRAQTISVPSAS